MAAPKVMVPAPYLPTPICTGALLPAQSVTDVDPAGSSSL
jgi:hypothetical protein